jgi:hypothetical protein
MFTINSIKKLFIPRGLYCYKSLKVVPHETLGFVLKIRECLFYRHFHDLEGFCILEDALILDQCKICGIRDGYEKLESYECL